MREKTLLFSTNTPQESLCQRLFHEFVEAVHELRQDPKSYLAGAIAGEGMGGHRRKTRLEYGLAISLLLYSDLFLIMLVVQTI